MVALRLVSEGSDDRVVNHELGSYGTRGEDAELAKCLRGIALPSRDVLLTLLWALKVEDQRISRKSEAVCNLGTQSPGPTTYVLKVNNKVQKRKAVKPRNVKRPRLA